MQLPCTPKLSYCAESGKNATVWKFWASADDPLGTVAILKVPFFKTSLSKRGYLEMRC